MIALLVLSWFRRFWYIFSYMIFASHQEQYITPTVRFRARDVERCSNFESAAVLSDPPFCASLMWSMMFEWFIRIPLKSTNLLQAIGSHTMDHTTKCQWSRDVHVNVRNVASGVDLASEKQFESCRLQSPNWVLVFSQHWSLEITLVSFWTSVTELSWASWQMQWKLLWQRSGTNC
jgi:hypothetical protein